MASDPGDLSQWPPFVAEVAADAMTFAGTHPRVALSQARLAVEALCGHLHRREIGPTDHIGFDEILRSLVHRRVLTPQRELPIKTVQAWGNYGSHPIDFAKLDAAFIAPCLAALQQVLAWYFVEYLRQPLPPAFARTAPPVEVGASVVVVSGSLMGKRVGLSRGRTILIGREPGVDVYLDDPKVHRAHARIEFPAGGRPAIFEVTGRNPTRVNDIRIEGSAPLQNGDHIQVGRTILRVELLD